MALLGLTLSNLLGGGGNTAPTAAPPTASVLTGQAATNLGPLTTVFTPPAACATAVAACSTCNSALLAQTCGGSGEPADAASCWPPTSSGVAFRGAGFYSPGVDCPAGYATACSATAGGSAGWPLQFALAASETAVGCCPNGYQCGNVNGQTCIQIATSTAVPTVACEANGQLGNPGVQSVPDLAASMTAYTLFAPMIQINFQSSDLAAAAAVPAKTSAKPSSTLVTSATSAAAKSSASSGSVETLTAMTAPPTTLQTAAATGGGTLDTDGGSAPSMTGNAVPAVPPMQTSDSAAGGTAAGDQAAAQTSEPASTSSVTSGLSMPARVAAAVGGGVGAAALIVGAVLLNRRLWRNRRNKGRDSMNLKLDDIYDPAQPTFFTEPDLLPGGRSRRTFLRGSMFTRGYRL